MLVVLCWAKDKDTLEQEDDDDDDDDDDDNEHVPPLQVTPSPIPRLVDSAVVPATALLTDGQLALIDNSFFSLVETTPPLIPTLLLLISITLSILLSVGQLKFFEDRIESSLKLIFVFSPEDLLFITRF
uniref:Uncharacterized protein n=1 Tax=Octopus bimaculoides TaxID=37653 RepID=A0A0L8IFP6_OCTBM